jgi:type I restriction enzyme S subunit
MVPNKWVDNCIGDLIKGLESGVSVNGIDRLRLSGEKAVLRVSAVTYGTFNPFAAKVITIPSELQRAKTKPKLGQIVISRSNTEELVGASAFIDTEYPDLYLPDKLWQTIPKSTTHMKWLSYILASDHVRYTLSNLATGTSGSMKNITKGELLGVKVSVPPILEQRKIAKVLSTWDKAINSTRLLIDNSRQKKKSLMQQLLTGKKRLFDDSGKPFEIEWEVRSLQDVVSKTRKITYGIVVPGPNEPGGNLMIRAQDYSFGWGDVDNIYRVSDDVHKSYKRSHVRKGDVLLTIVGSVGNTAIVPEHLDGANLTQQTARLSIDESDEYFVYSVISSPIGRKEIFRYTKSGVQPSLNLSDIAKFKIPTPSLQEQKKITCVFMNADKEIELLEQQLADLKLEKKALMQQLLTGKRRVTANEGEAD